MFELLSNLAKLFKSIGLPKKYLIIIFPVVLMIYSIPYVYSLSISNIELLLSQKDYYKKRHISVFIIIFTLLAFINFILTLNITFLICEGILLGLGFIFLFVRFILNLIHPIDWINKIGTDVETMILMILVPLILTIIFYFMGKYPITPEEIKIAIEQKNINLISEIIIDKTTVFTYVITSTIETIVLILQMGGIAPTNTNVIVKNDYASYFVYNKLDKEHLLCGNEYNMNDASNIIVISINDIFERKYSLAIYKKESETEKKKKHNFFKSKEEKKYITLNQKNNKKVNSYNDNNSKKVTNH